MNERMDPIADENEIAAAIEDALREAVKHRERSDGRFVQVAERARGIAVELSDRAFAAALRSILAEVRNNWEAGCEVMVLAERFAHLAGAKSFSRETRSLIAELRQHVPDSQQLDGVSGSPGLPAAFRAYVLALARTIGVSITVRDLKREKLLRKQEPMLWLDLVTECLAPDVYVDSVRSLLEADAFSPFEFVRRLPMIVRHQGVSIAQEVLDAACHHLYGKGRYDDAWTLITRAEDFESRGWRLPVSGRVVDVSGLSTTRDYTKTLLFDPLEFSNADAVRIVERFRSHMASHFSLIDDDRGECDRSEEEQQAREAEEGRRMHLRIEIFEKLRDYRDYEQILMTMVRPQFRHVDASGCDWWQDFSLNFIDCNTGKEKFTNVIQSAGKTTIGLVDTNKTREASSQVPSRTDRPSNSGQLEDELQLKDDLMCNAKAVGF